MKRYAVLMPVVLGCMVGGWWVCPARPARPPVPAGQTNDRLSTSSIPPHYRHALPRHWRQCLLQQ